MLDDLLRLVSDAGSLQSRLVLVLGGSYSSRSDLLAGAAVHLDGQVLPLGIHFARLIATVPRRQRPLQAGPLLRDVVDASFKSGPVAVLDRIEVLFDRSLRLDALDALKRLAHSRTVVAAWPGELRNGRLLYAPASHPEHCDHAVGGYLVHEIT
ncbi:MAG: BREX-3 system P-loop-containing protein BrxF [Betaproteobacteria bacterium]